MHYQVKFHTQKIPNFSYGLCSTIRAEAVSKMWAKPKHKFGQVLVNCFQIISLT